MSKCFTCLKELGFDTTILHGSANADLPFDDAVVVHNFKQQLDDAVASCTQQLETDYNSLIRRHCAPYFDGYVAEDTSAGAMVKAFAGGAHLVRAMADAEAKDMGKPAKTFIVQVAVLDS